MDNYIPFILIPLISWGVLKYLKKNNKLTALKKRTLLIAMVAYAVTELGRSFYRPYIYKNNINDYFIANTIGNSFGTVTAIFMILTLSGKSTGEDWKIVVVIVFGLLFYELLNLTGKTAIDINDMIATIIFGSISAVTYYILLRKYGGKDLSNDDSMQ